MRGAGRAARLLVALHRYIDGRFLEIGRREILERDLAALKQHVSPLQAGITDIERRLGAA